MGLLHGRSGVGSHPLAAGHPHCPGSAFPGANSASPAGNAIPESSTSSPRPVAMAADFMPAVFQNMSNQSTSATLVYINKYSGASALRGTEFLALGMECLAINNVLRKRRENLDSGFILSHKSLLSWKRPCAICHPQQGRVVFLPLQKLCHEFLASPKPCIVEIRFLQNAHYATSTIQLPQYFVLLH